MVKKNLEHLKKEFDEVSKDIKDKNCLDLKDFLRIFNYKANVEFEIDKREICRVTKEAFDEKRSLPEKLELLFSLKGVGLPMASAILAMKYPEKYAIVDRNVIKALRSRRYNIKSIPTNLQDNNERKRAIGLYEEYMKALKVLQGQDCEFKEKTFREIEIKLFEEGRTKNG